MNCNSENITPKMNAGRKSVGDVRANHGGLRWSGLQGEPSENTDVLAGSQETRGHKQESRGEEQEAQEQAAGVKVWAGGGQGTARKVRKGSERLGGQKTQGPRTPPENWGFVPEAMGNLSTTKRGVELGVFNITQRGKRPRGVSGRASGWRTGPRCKTDSPSADPSRTSLGKAEAAEVNSLEPGGGGFNTP